MPPKKKAGGSGGGDATKGEKVFKNLCSACHSLSVIESSILSNYFSLTQLVRLSAVSQVTTSLQEKASATPQPLPQRPH